MKRIGRWARRFGLARAVCVVLLLALLPLRVVDPRPIEELRLRTFDLFQVMRPRQQTAWPVLVVDIDEASLNEIGQWPWPRTILADLVTRLTALGAVAIGFDAVFPEPDRTSPNLLATTLRDLDDATRERLRSLPSNDEVLAAAMRQSRVALGESVSDNVSAGPAVEASGYGVVTAKGAPDARTFLRTFSTLVGNLPILDKAAAGRGIFTQVEEHDGIVRRAPVIMNAQNAFVPSLSLELLRVATKSNSPLIRSGKNGIQSVSASRFLLPTDEHGRLWVHFNHTDPRRYVSAKDVLQGGVPAERIRGKIVLVGTSAIGLSDNKTTPLDPVIPGVEIHAQIIESILSNALLSAPSWGIGAEVIAAVAFGLLIIIAAPMLPAAVVIALGGILILGLIGLSWFFFAEHNLLIDFTYPLTSTWLIYLVLTFVNYFRVQRERQQIRAAFGFYLSPPLVEQLAKSPEKLVLGGEERRMTILFSDVRGFTTISEHYKDDPQGLTHLMNRFLTPLTNAIIERKGTIDKYIGDAIMAFWNAPLDDAEHEANACGAALEMQARAEALNLELKREAENNGGTYMPLRIGIGLNSGPCVVGNMGSDFRFNYSVLGDTVNLASRLESRTKDYRLPLVIGARTAEGAKAKFATMEIDLIQVKGKKQPEVVFTVLGRAELEQDPRCRDLQALNAQMLVSYRKQQWDEALDLIDRCRKLADGFEAAGLYDMYAERIEAYRVAPPAPDWNGVYEAETK